MRARDARLGVHERHAVLQLVSKPVRAARLVQRRPRPHSARQRLVQRPSIEQRVELRLRRVNTDHRQPLVPRLGCFVDRLGRGGRRAVPLDQRTRSRIARRRAEQDRDLLRLVRLERDVAPQRRARVVPRAGRARELLHAQPLGRGEIAVPSDEVIAARCVARERLADPRERDAAGEVGREEILREQRAGRRIVPRVKLMPRLLLLRAEHPVDVARQRETARRVAAIRDSESGDLDRVAHRNAHGELGDDVAARVREARHAGGMFDSISRRMVRVADSRGGPRCRRPHDAAVRVPEIDHLAARVGDRIVEPRRESKEIAVLRPREAAASLRHAESDRRIGDDVRPRCRRHSLAGDVDLEVARVRQPAVSVRRLRRRVGLVEHRRGDAGMRGQRPATKGRSFRSSQCSWRRFRPGRPRHRARECAPSLGGERSRRRTTSRRVARTRRPASRGRLPRRTWRSSSTGRAAPARTNAVSRSGSRDPIGCPSSSSTCAPRAVAGRWPHRPRRESSPTRSANRRRSLEPTAPAARASRRLARWPEREAPRADRRARRPTLGRARGRPARCRGRAPPPRPRFARGSRRARKRQRRDSDRRRAARLRAWAPPPW